METSHDHTLNISARIDSLRGAVRCDVQVESEDSDDRDIEMDGRIRCVAFDKAIKTPTSPHQCGPVHLCVCAVSSVSSCTPVRSTSINFKDDIYYAVY